MTETHKTCTVRNAVTGVCGKPAIYVEGEFAECEEHANQAGSLMRTRHLVGAKGTKPGAPKIGDKVEVHRYGKKYLATVVYVGKRGRVEAEFTYNNGSKRRVAI